MTAQTAIGRYNKIGGCMDKRVGTLEKLGFQKASKGLKSELDFKRKCVVAYENFRYVTPAQFDKCNERLKKKTMKIEGRSGIDLYHNYDKLKFVPVKDYETIPPEEVLEKIEVALEKDCFDSLEVCKIESVREYKDPIVFGCIKGLADKFFITQWDNDIKIEDILEENEG